MLRIVPRVPCGDAGVPRGDMPSAAMASPNTPAAGGFLIALGAIVGAGVGLSMGETTSGFLIGTAIGIVLSLVIWWRGRT